MELLQLFLLQKFLRQGNINQRGYLVAAERDGYVLDFADFGNSPLILQKKRLEGKTIVYSTTNGTGIINLASSAYMTVIGSFLNIECSYQMAYKTG